MAISYGKTWGTIISCYSALFVVPYVSLLLALGSSQAQNFNSTLNDTSYIDLIEQDIGDEVNRTREVFYKQAQLLDNVARQFVAAQLKENLFIALRVLVEKELDEKRQNESLNESTTLLDSDFFTPTTLRPYNRTKRQDDGDDDGDDGDGGAAAAAAGGVPSRPTIPPQIGLFPQVANLVRVIFGGNQAAGGVNLTSYVASASKLLPRPVGNQVLGLVKILTNANANRNSYTTANPLLQGAGLNGQLPGANINLKSPVAGFTGLTPEQLVALGLPPQTNLDALNSLTPEALASLSPEALNSLAGLSGLPGLGPINGLGPLDVNYGIPPGLSAADLAALASLGVPLPPDQQKLSTQQLPRSTKKPRPQYSPQIQPEQQQTLEQPLAVHNQNQNPSYEYGQNPQFIASEKDVLPLNLNPNKQTISEIQQQLQEQLLPKYQEAPQSPEIPQTINQPQKAAKPLANTASHAGVVANLPPKRNQAVAEPGLSGGLGKQQEKLQQHSGNIGLEPASDIHAPAVAASNKPSETGGSSGKPNRKQVQQEQALLQAEQLQLILQQQQQQLLQQQQNPQQTLQNQENLHEQLVEPQIQPLQQQQQPPLQNQEAQLQQQLQHAQALQQIQQNLQQQQQLQPQQNNPQLQQLQQQVPQQQIQQQQLQQPSEFTQQFQQLYQPRPQRPPPPAVDEEDSEESDVDPDDGDDDRRRERGARQFNFFQNLLPALLNGNRNNNNNQNNNNINNNNNNPNNNNNNNQNNNNGNNNNNNMVPQSPQNNQPGGMAPGNQGNGTMTMANGNFDLGMFAQNLSRGIGDVVRVMPDLFRGAREGLQLIQALSTILQAFPGLTDVIPIF